MKKWFVVMIAMTLIAPPAYAHGKQKPGEQQAIAQAEAALGKIERLAARFSQTTSSKGFGVTGAYSGVIHIEKPGKMRFAYDNPAGRLIVSDGVKVKIVDEKEGRISSRPVAGYIGGASPALFLAGKAPLSDLFHIRLAPPPKGSTIKTTRLALTPKKPADNVKAMLLEFTGEVMTVSALTIVDYIGNRNRIEFINVTSPSSIDPSLFAVTGPGQTKSGNP